MAHDVAEIGADGREAALALAAINGDRVQVYQAIRLPSGVRIDQAPARNDDRRTGGRVLRGQSDRLHGAAEFDRSDGSHEPNIVVKLLGNERRMRYGFAELMFGAAHADEQRSDDGEQLLRLVAVNAGGRGDYPLR